MVQGQVLGLPTITLNLVLRVPTVALNGVQEGILMDYVPKKQRAQWKSLESISSFGWCGSAALGGYLSDKYGYTTTFLIAIAMQTCATLCYSTLTTVVINKRPQDMKPKQDATP